MVQQRTGYPPATLRLQVKDCSNGSMATPQLPFTADPPAREGNILSSQAILL